MTYLLAYFVFSAFVSAGVAAQEEIGIKKVLTVLILALFCPVAAVLEAGKSGWEWCEKYLQIKTFWNFLFNRAKLKRTPDELARMRRITLKYKATKSLPHRLWRLAERCHFKVNKYKPIE